MGIVDHLTFQVSDYARSKAFYLAALAPLGIKLLAEEDGAAGFGTDKPEFWFYEGVPVAPPFHVAFVAQSRAEVDAFYQAAMDAGGVDNGKPGLRPHYHAGYYGAFVRDPDGMNVEAVCHI